MRIACVDKTATERIALERFLDESFRECRKSIGHLVVARLVPMSKEELLINTLPDCVVLGAGFGVEESLLLAREIKSSSSAAPVYVFLSAQDYTIKNLKRFAGYANEVFSVVDLPSRFVFKLTSVESSQSESKKGFLFAWQGVKGGVGTTSLVGGVAHAIQDLGKTVAVVDLSRRGEFCQFFLSDKWQSTYYSQLVVDSQLPDPDHLDKALVYLQNGIPVLPPPAGADELREQWLRDPARLEVGLSFIELLLEKYDVVLVDFAHAEGILPFAIECRADARIFVSANDPSSVHLLVHRVNDFSLPVEGVTRFLINQTISDGLTQEDVLDFISWSPSFTEEMLHSEPIPFEKKGGHWIGTGNSFFTESNTKIQQTLRTFVSEALGLDTEKQRQSKRTPFKNALKSITSRRAKKFIPFAEREMLPYYTSDDFSKSNSEQVLQSENAIKADVEKKPINPFQSVKASESLSVNKFSANHEDEYEYDPPKIRANE
jgi:cellulose biosynthesis protein BcsQ